MVGFFPPGAHRKAMSCVLLKGEVGVRFPSRSSVTKFRGLIYMSISVCHPFSTNTGWIRDILGNDGDGE